MSILPIRRSVLDKYLLDFLAEIVLIGLLNILLFLVGSDVRDPHKDRRWNCWVEIAGG